MILTCKSRSNNSYPFGIIQGVYFTLIEMLVVITIISILASMMLPSLMKAREAAYKTACLGNQRQLGVAMNMYLDNNQGVYDVKPANNYSCQIWNGYSPVGYRRMSHGNLYDYAGDLGVYFCPSTTWFDTNWHNISPKNTRKNWDTLTSVAGISNKYGISSYVSSTYALQRLGSYRLGTMKNPPAFFFDALAAGYPVPSGTSDALFLTNPIVNHNYDGFNVLKADNSGKWFAFSSFSTGALGERNTFTSGIHLGCDKFWETVSDIKF